MGVQMYSEKAEEWGLDLRREMQAKRTGVGEQKC